MLLSHKSGSSPALGGAAETASQVAAQRVEGQTLSAASTRYVAAVSRPPAVEGRGGFAVWNALAEDPSVSRHLLVFGQAVMPDHARRALRGTTITVGSREQIETVLGPLLPDTKVLLDHSGTILMSDSRTAASECGWSFEAQVGALRGVLASGVIRSQP